MTKTVIIYFNHIQYSVDVMGVEMGVGQDGSPAVPWDKTTKYTEPIPTKQTSLIPDHDVINCKVLDNFRRKTY